MDVLCILYFVQTAIVLSIKQEPSTFSVLGLPSFGLCECWLSLWVLLFFFSRDLYVNHLGCFCKIKCTIKMRGKKYKYSQYYKKRWKYFLLHHAPDVSMRTRRGNHITFFETPKYFRNDNSNLKLLYHKFEIVWQR